MFIASLVAEIAKEDNPDNVRQMAGVIFKNFISNQSNVRWKSEKV